MVGHPPSLAVIQLSSSSQRQPLLQVPPLYFREGAFLVDHVLELLQVLSLEVGLSSLRQAIQPEDSSLRQEDSLAVHYSVTLHLSSVALMRSTQLPRKLKGMKMRILEMMRPSRLT